MEKFSGLTTSPGFAVASLALTLLMASAAPVYAQGALEEIIVTAEFREANVQDTPIAITAISSEMLEFRNQTNIYEVAAQAPNVTLQPAGQSFSGMYAFIRGIGQYDFIYAVEPGVGIYVDDVYYSTLSNSLLELLDLQRVEILRGPQGTLAGRNSIGGAVKLYSKKPGDEHGGQVQLSYGSYNKISGNASGDFTIVPDQLFARFAVAAKSRDGYVDLLDYGCVYPGSGVATYRTSDGCKTGELGNQQYVTGRASFRWLATDDIEVNLIADVMNDDSGAGPAVLLYNHKPTATPLCAPDDGNPATPLVCYLNNVFVPYGPNAPANAINDPYVNYATFADMAAPTATTPWKPVQMDPINTLDEWGISGQIDWQINDTLSLTSITAYRAYESFFNADADGSPVAVTMVGSQLDHWSITQEVRLNGNFNDIVDWTLGGYYLDQEGLYEARVDLNYANLDFVHGPDETPSSSTAVFGHATWHVNDRLNLFAGLRYSDEEKDYTHHRRNPNLSTIGPPPSPNFQVGPLNLAQDHFADDRIDYRAGVDYAWTDDFMTYFQVSTGYKGGGVNPRPFFLEQMKPFGPEELTTFEIGFKSTLLDNRMRLNGAGFFNDYTDIQLNLSACERPAGPPFNGVPGAPCAAPRNVGDADVWGAELEMEYYPIEAIALDASISWLDFQYPRVDTGALTGSPILPIDMVAPFTPEIKWSIGAQYTFAPTAYGTLSARINANYQDQIYSTPTNDDTYNLIEDYTLVNARLTWNSPDEDWQAALEFNNITDELYYLNLFDQHQTTSVGQVIANPGLPFTWGISIKRYF